MSNSLNEARMPSLADKLAEQEEARKAVNKAEPSAKTEATEKVVNYKKKRK